MKDRQRLIVAVRERMVYCGRAGCHPCERSIRQVSLALQISPPTEIRHLLDFKEDELREAEENASRYPTPDQERAILRAVQDLEGSAPEEGRVPGGVGVSEV